MVVLAASICTKGGKPVISRQYREMPRSRIESLLASFPKLIPANSQHTSIETADVRYVYQPLEELYILLITNKASNILQDIDTLHLFARVVSDLCRSAEEREISKNAFELLGAFDEVVSLGYREQVNLMQVRNVLEMESHEEKIQEIIARNKEAEAKEELKRRAKQLEMQRREQQRRAAGMGGGSGGYLGGSSGYSSVPRFDAPERTTPRAPTPGASGPRPTTTTPSFKGSGLKLGGKKVKQDQLLDALGGELVTPELSRAATPSSPVPESAAEPSSVPTVPQESVHVQIREQLNVSLTRDGALKALELKGDMNLIVTDPSLSRIRLNISQPSSGDVQFKQHPNVGKFNPSSNERVIALKDPSRGFPVGQPLGVLRWRLAGKDESFIPLSINCWPTPSNDGSCDVNIEYELENDRLTLHDLVITIPLPSGSYPSVSNHTGSWSLNASTHSLDWSIPLVSAEDDTRSGSLEFNVGGDDVSAFFPVKVTFTGVGSMVDLEVSSVTKVEGGDDTTFSQDATVTAADYTVS